MTDDELKALVASLAVDSKNLHEAQKATDEQIKATNAQMKATFEQIKHNDKMLTDKLDRMGIRLGSMGQNQGSVAEEFFFNSLKDKQILAEVHYDFIDKNVLRTHNGVSDEYDMILANAEDVAIVEVKYKAHQGDLTKLLTKKYKNFIALFPAYKSYRHHLVLATFYLNNDLKEQALQNNVIILQRKGELVQSYLPLNGVLHNQNTLRVEEI